MTVMTKDKKRKEGNKTPKKTRPAVDEEIGSASTWGTKETKRFNFHVEENDYEANDLVGSRWHRWMNNSRRVTLSCFGSDQQGAKPCVRSS
jgi:hypothetical protein